MYAGGIIVNALKSYILRYLEEQAVRKMIFEVSADQIERLDQNQLVKLLGRVIHAELAKHDIPLRSGTAPTQITIPDGGDDGRVSWTGGPSETNWLPSRFVIFQAKKGKTTPTGLKKEVWKKSSNKAAPELSEAVEEVLQHGGSYIVVTATPVVGTKVTNRITKIREGITEAGGNPSLLSAIEIYDSNKIASWTNVHPSVALWLNSLLREFNLQGFQSYEDWGKASDVSELPFQQSEEPRFVLEGNITRIWNNEDDGITKPKTFVEIRQLVNDFFRSKGNSIRVVGPSGIGKTRLTHELVSVEIEPQQDFLHKCQVVYCVYDDVRERIVNITRELVALGSRSVLVVDDCPESEHAKLSELVNREESRCLLVTTGVETKSQGNRKNLVIRIGSASEELIKKIAGSVNERVSNRNSFLIRELSQGFPKMAILASRAIEDGDEELTSVESLVTRIVWGRRQEDPAAFESLQLFSLFSIIGMENEASGGLEALASFSNKPYRIMYQQLTGFVGRGVVRRQGDYGLVQPIPLAMRLAHGWIESQPSGTLEELFQSVNGSLKLSMISRLRWLSLSEKAIALAAKLVNDVMLSGSALGDFEWSLLDGLVHLSPDAVMLYFSNFLGDKVVDELLEFDQGRRQTIVALEKLVFRHQTFLDAARLLMKLSAAETERWANNASGQFTQLYNLYLSGTEASPKQKIALLDEGLADPDQRIRKVCISALEKMLDSGSYSRTGGAENIGTTSLQDWEPSTWGDIFDYHRAALNRLEKIASDTDDPHAELALDSIRKHLRGMFNLIPMFDEIQGIIERLRQLYPRWYQPIISVNQWLYFDRRHAGEDYADYVQKIRSYYDELLPDTDDELLLLYTAGWGTAIHDPDTEYSQGSGGDYQYCSRRVEEIISSSSILSKDYSFLLEEFLTGQYRAIPETVATIAQHVDDPENLLEDLLHKDNDKVNKAVLAQITHAIICGARKTERSKGLNCLNAALGHEDFKAYSINLIAATGLDNTLMEQAIGYVEDDVVSPYQSTAIAFGDVLESIQPQLIESMLSTLLTKGESGAWAAIAFLSRMLYRAELADGWLAEITLKAVTNPALFECSPDSSQDLDKVDWYDWHRLVDKLFNAGCNQYHRCEQIIGFVVSVLDISEYDVQYTFRNDAREVLRRISDYYPKLVWDTFHELRANTDTDVLAKHRLRSFFGEGSSRLAGKGVLNEISPDIYVPWMLEDKAERIKFILSWMQMFECSEPQETESEIWIPEFITFVDAYVDDPDQLNTLYSRLTTGVSIGSWTSRLEIERKKLQLLLEMSSNPYVQRWASQALAQMDTQIADQRRRDANFEATHFF